MSAAIVVPSLRRAAVFGLVGGAVIGYVAFLASLPAPDLPAPEGQYSSASSLFAVAAFLGALGGGLVASLAWTVVRLVNRLTASRAVSIVLMTVVAGCLGGVLLSAYPSVLDLTVEPVWRFAALGATGAVIASVASFVRVAGRVSSAREESPRPEGPPHRA